MFFEYVKEKISFKKLLFYRKIENLLAKYDVFILPTTPYVAPKLPQENENYIEAHVPMNVNCCLFNLTGHPAISVNCGFVQPQEGDDKRTDMPVGMQIVSRYMQESKVLRVAKTVEELVGRRTVFINQEK